MVEKLDDRNTYNSTMTGMSRIPMEKKMQESNKVKIPYKQTNPATVELNIMMDKVEAIRLRNFHSTKPSEIAYVRESDKTSKITLKGQTVPFRSINGPVPSPSVNHWRRKRFSLSTNTEHQNWFSSLPRWIRDLAVSCG